MSIITQRRIEAFSDSNSIHSEEEDQEAVQLTLMEQVVLLGLKDQKVSSIDCRVTCLSSMILSLTYSVAVF